MQVTEQPKIDTAMSKLASGYDHFGVLVDLYGEESKRWGIEVMDVSLPGTGISLAEWFTAKDFRTMESRIEFQRIHDKNED